MSDIRSITVRVSVGDVEVNRYPSEDLLVGGWEEPDYEHRPAVVIAACPITVLFGDGPPSKAPRRTKRVVARVQLDADAPTEDEWTEATERALVDLAANVSRHGFDVLPPTREDNPR